MTKKREVRGFTSFGFSTILLSFVMICVVTFSALSLVTAYSDYKLSKKVAERNSNYYKAEENAYDKVADIDLLLADIYVTASGKESYFLEVNKYVLEYGTVTFDEENYYLSFCEDISHNQQLCVKMRIIYPQKATDRFYEIIEWKSVYEASIPEDNTLNLIK